MVVEDKNMNIVLHMIENYLGEWLEGYTEDPKMLPSVDFAAMFTIHCPSIYY